MPSIGRSPYTETEKRKNRQVDDRVKPEKRKAMDKAASDPRHKNERVPVDDSVTTVKIEDGAITAQKLAPNLLFNMVVSDVTTIPTPIAEGQIAYELDNDLKINVSSDPNVPDWRIIGSYP